jgi:PAS domain S-box-containing protein
MDTIVFNLLVGMLFISGISMAAVGWYARRFIGRVPAATPFILLMFCAAAWSILYALDLLTMSLPLRVFYHDLRFLFLPFFSVLELWLVVAYVKRPDWLRRDGTLLTLIIPVAAAILAITNPYHTLFQYNFSIDTAGLVPVLLYSDGVFFQIYFVYSFVLLALAVILLITESRKRGTLREMPTLLLLVALAFPTALNYISQISDLPSPGINLTPAVLWIAAILYAVALFHYHFLDIIPIARSRLIEALSKPVLVLDTDRRIIDTNPAACELFSITPAAALGKRIEEIVPDWPEFLALCGEKTTRKRDLVRARQDGTHYYIGSAEPLLTHQGVAEGNLIFLQDVTELKRAEEALRENEEKYRSIVDEMQDIFYRTDVAGKIVMLSPSAARLAGYASNNQLLGQDVTRVYEDPAGREKILAALKEKGSVYAYPLTLRTRDGTIHHVTTSSHFYRDAQGAIQGVEGVIHDITEQWQAEEALRIANKKLNLLSSITRHDIRNQLMALMAFLELSVESIDNPAELAEFLKKNQKIADTIAKQITFTKGYEDLGVKAPSWQEVNASIEHAVEGLPVQGIRISVETAGLEIFADPLVERVFYNLIDNALRYGSEKMTTIRITSHPAGSSLVLVFEDDGTGIAAGDKEAIFDRGFGKNTGLGLFLTREILSITGITIAETGVFGEGARFEMTILAGGFRFTS